MTKELNDLTKRIKDREEVISAIGQQAKGIGSSLLVEALLQGKDLIAVKASLKHGEWLLWLDQNFSMKPQRAQAYMRLANASRDKQLDGATSIRQALALLDAPTEMHPTTQPQSWPAYYEGINRTSKLLAFFNKHPFNEWPNEGVEKLRDDLLPIAQKLWPDKF